MRRQLLAPLLFGSAALLFTTPSDAGASYDYFGCSQYSSTYAYCFGNFRGASRFPDSTTAASFRRSEYGDSFTAYYGGRYYSCSVPSNYLETRRVWDGALAGGGYFFVDMNPSTGVCTGSSVEKGSQFSTY